jgi:uncharacterized repeat protein (TIGR03806 family)
MVVVIGSKPSGMGGWFLAACAGLSGSVLCAADDPPPFGIEQRISWTTSRVVGSPEPPLPYTTEKTFANIQWQAPIFLTPEPESDRLLVVSANDDKGRPSRILRVAGDPKADQTETFLEVRDRLIYSIAFHPEYRTNRQVYVFFHGTGGELAKTNRISRFTVEREEARRCDPQSEQVIIEWRSEGHDGGGLVFGHDGMLYISTGDGTTDSDGWVTGQDLNEILGGVLRINVDLPNGTQAYSVPNDNPFVGMKDARPENWAYGLRNPWRMCLDEKTGAIWVGNNGQDLWETVHVIRRGENYGWSVYEGSRPFYLNRKPGPTPPVSPTIEHSHAEFRSLTGGVVYQGTQLPELDGVYVYGDYATGEIWGARHDGSRVTSLQRLAQTPLQITAFAVDQRGELLYRLVRSPLQRPMQTFPSRLSETGLFESTKDHKVQPGLIPYSVNAPGWADGAVVERFMGLPDDSKIGKFTNGTVLVQTLSLDRKAGDPASRQRIETRFLTLQNTQWAGYSWRWNEEQSDATLVGAKGDEREVAVGDARAPGGFRRQLWRFPGRIECMTCHSRAANFVLGLTDSQLNKVHDYGGVRVNQLRTLQHLGVFTGSVPGPSDPALVDPSDPGKPLEARARSWLHVNCSVCHVESGGGNSKMDLRFGIKPEQMSLFSARPQHDTFGLDNAMLIFPGEPERSVLYQRISHRGRGQMPPLVTSVPDERAITLFRDWIREMKPPHEAVRDWKMEDLLPSLEQVSYGRSFESGRAAFRLTGCVHCHRFAGEGGSVGPDLSAIGRRLSPSELIESLILPSKVIAEGFATTVIETKSGEAIGGRIEREDDRVVVIRPLAAADEAVTIRKTDIRASSANSNMPAGTVNTLSETQVLDLLAYLISGGASDHPAFRPGAATNPTEK